MPCYYILAMSNHLTPLQVCEALIGPLPKIETICGHKPKAAYSWRRGSMYRDRDDIPSPRHMRALLAYSAARGLGLSEAHLIWGAEAAEIEEILARRAADPPIAAE